jgi:hypothetical protein
MFHHPIIYITLCITVYSVCSCIFYGLLEPCHYSSSVCPWNSYFEHKQCSCILLTLQITQYCINTRFLLLHKTYVFYFCHLPCIIVPLWPLSSSYYAGASPFALQIDEAVCLHPRGHSSPACSCSRYVV